MKSIGTISGSAYAGQKYWVVWRSKFPRWYMVQLVDENGHAANREVMEKFLEEE